MRKRNDAQYDLARAVWDNVDCGPKPKKKKKFKWFDTRTFFGRLSIFLAPILYVGLVATACIIGYSISDGWGALFQVSAMLGPFLVPILIQASYWLFTGKTRWNW